MKILFITTNDINKSFGGAIGSKRNYDFLCKYFGSENVDVLLLKERPNKTFKEKLIKNINKYFTCSQFDIRQLKGIDFSRYNLIFNDNSVIGKINKYLKENGFKNKIITYFHNCEYSLYHQLYKNSSILIRYILYRIVKVNEKAALKYSDSCVILNQRDLNEIKRIYKCSFNYKIIPVSIKDTYKKAKIKEELNVRPIFTFIGSYFKPNVDGIMWLIENVLPFVNIKLRIIGMNMDKLSSQIRNNNVEILSNIPDLDEYIRVSDCMIYPIFEGSGMKLKTCEALMYGKNIIGTPEAFMGYDIENFNEIGACCHNSDEFIDAINNFNLPRYNVVSRRIFQEKYSYDASYKEFLSLMKDMKL